MFENLIESFNIEKWQELGSASKNQDDFKEYHVNRHHKQIDNTTIHYLVAVEDGDPLNVELADVLPKKDPLKNVGVVELKLDADCKHIIGVDLNGDIVVRK